jgi:hypothetical protein
MPVKEETKIKNVSELIDEVIETVGKISDEYCRSLAFSSIAESLAKRGESEKDMQCIQRAIDIAGKISDEYCRSLALMRIAERLYPLEAIQKLERRRDE